MSDKTCALIKPDLVGKNCIGKVIAIIEENGFNIVKMQKLTMDQALAEDFYAVHADKPFFPEVVKFMTSGPIIAMELRKENAIKAWRDLMGATDPQKAAPGTIRALFGESIERNGTHGSDSSENAEREIDLIFNNLPCNWV